MVFEIVFLDIKFVIVNVIGYILYFIVVGNIGGVFDVDKVGGELKVLKYLDYE